MFKEAVFTRYLTYFLGALTTAVNIFLLTYFLEVNEFAVWEYHVSCLLNFTSWPAHICSIY